MNSVKSTDSDNYPHQLTNELWAFPPNKDCTGGTSWWLGCDPEPVLIDCPPFCDETIKALNELSSGRASRIILTGRQAHGRIRELQNALGWPVLIQEQEAYLLPAFHSLESFSEEHITASGLRVLWTPGPTPGSCVVYAPSPWNVLFCGRLLIPVAFNRMASLVERTTFHWSRQQKSLQKLRSWLPSNPRPALASGGGLHKLGGKKLVEWEAWRDAN